MKDAKQVSDGKRRLMRNWYETHFRFLLCEDRSRNCHSI